MKNVIPADVGSRNMKNVIPAQAGIQTYLDKSLLYFWFPAYAETSLDSRYLLSQVQAMRE